MTTQQKTARSYHINKNNLHQEIYMFMLGMAFMLLLTMVIGKVAGHKVTKITDHSEITWVSDPGTLDSVFDEFESVNGEKVLGLSEPDITNNKCTVYAPMPNGKYNKTGLEILGHEVLHCFAGQYHK